MLTVATRASDAKSESGWSADLLQQILRTEAGRPSPASPAPAGEMVLHTYRLTHLRIGAAGKPQNVLAILGRLLPAGSSINPDVPGNSVHILTTAAAHAAVWDYLSAVDVADAPIAPAGVPDDVRTALQKLADAGEQSGRLLAAITAVRTDVTRELADIQARQRAQAVRLSIAAGCAAIVVLATLAWIVRRRAATAAAVRPAEQALALAPDQLSSALAPAHDRMRNDMLGLLNEVAIKLQAQHNEQQQLVREQQQQLEAARIALAEERRQFISETGSMVVQAVERVDATTAKLAKQQDKVAELVEELQHTVRELDETKDNLRSKQVELEQERAKIAALSLLLEEGGAIPPPAPNGHGLAPPAAGDRFLELRLSLPSSSSCQDSTPNPNPRSNRSRLPLTFLPPDHPET